MDSNSLKAFISPRTVGKLKPKYIFLEQDKNKVCKKVHQISKEKPTKSQSIKLLESIEKGTLSQYLRELQTNIKQQSKRIDQKIKMSQEKIGVACKQNIYPQNGSNIYKSCENLKKIPSKSVYDKLLADYSSKFSKKQSSIVKIQESSRHKNRSFKEVYDDKIFKKDNKINLHVNTQISEWIPNKKLDYLLGQAQTTTNNLSKALLEPKPKLLKTLFHQKKKSNMSEEKKFFCRNLQKLTIKNFEIIKKLGKGRFGNVYLAQDKKSHLLVALKSIQKKLLKDNDMLPQLKQQIKIQLYLNHPNLLKMYGFFDDDENIYLILQNATHGNLFRELRQERRFSEKKAAVYLKQVCESLVYLHNQGVIHRDIKPQNILITCDVLKLSDFGWSIYSPEMPRETFCGTLDYVSPEIVIGKTYDYTVDLWSIGVLCYELVTGRAPFQKKDGTQEQTYEKILKTQIEYPEYLSKGVKNFIDKLLVKNPRKRMSLQDALKHQWLLENTKGAFTINRMLYNQFSGLNK